LSPRKFGSALNSSIPGFRIPEKNHFVIDTGYGLRYVQTFYTDIPPTDHLCES
jgi:hypothetical protein